MSYAKTLDVSAYIPEDYYQVVTENCRCGDYYMPYKGLETYSPSLVKGRNMSDYWGRINNADYFADRPDYYLVIRRRFICKRQQ